MELQPARQVQIATRHRARVERCVEQLCQQGCRKVNESIAVLRSGASVPGLEDLDVAEHAEVLRELVSIMAVYQDNCSS